ncbi:hypothetical protein TNCV_3046561 [Trichonephila clavipes]|uniref:Uncharacterized protein n=1 Tax=Trichonephila clavipes TaxID=2585209 RepID=A0A8X6V6K8_TRICX|nr:hypothetical protein TNCV_3046561 [Trichonephila clavipes]
MEQTAAGFFSKHNGIPFRCPCSQFIGPLAAQTPEVSSQGIAGGATVARVVGHWYKSNDLRISQPHHMT